VPTTLSVDPASGVYGGTVTLTATLTRTDDSSPLGGKTISFTLNGNPVGTATTNGSGVATKTDASLSGILPGTYPSGVAASFAASELMPTFHNARSLGVVTKRPVVGMVTMFPSQAVRRMRRLSGILFAGASSAFVVSFAALFAFVLLLGRVV